MNNSNPTVQRLEDQIGWYDKKSAANKRWFIRLKVTEIVVAAIIPLAAGAKADPIITGLLGVAVVVFEGLQALNQFQHHWIAYRSTCEDLKHEKFLWLAKAGPYADAKNPDVLLAERVESLISREHTRWTAARDRNPPKTGNALP